MLEIVRVVGSHPESNAVDVVIMRTNVPVAGVQVITGMAGADHGTSGLMQPTEQSSTTPLSALLSPAAVIYGVMAYASGLPLLVGFLHPQVSQTLFADKNRFVWRHPSDVYGTVTDAGDLELAFPSGTFLRVGAAPDHEDLTGKDYDKRWAIARNKASAPWFSLAIANAGAAPHTTLRIDPEGNVSVYNAGNWSWHTGGNVTIQVDGNLAATVNGTTLVHAKGAATIQADSTVSLTAAGAITSSAPAWNHTGPFSVTGNVSAIGTVSIAGDLATTGGNISTTGGITAAGDVSGNGHSLSGHVHSGVRSGSDESGGPVG